MREDKKVKVGIQWFTALYLSIPLLLIFLLVALDSELGYNPLILIYTILYCAFLLVIMFSEDSSSQNQGYKLMILLLWNLMLILLFFFINQLSIYEFTESLAQTIEFSLLCGFFSFLAYFIGSIFFSSIIKFYKWLHKESYELEKNSIVLIEADNEKINLTFEDFSFSSFNRYIKVHTLWAIITLTLIPLPSNLSDISNVPPFFTNLTFYFFIIYIIGIPLGFVHFRSYKRNVKFKLRTITQQRSGSNDFEKEINLSDDLKSFLKISLIIGIASKLIEVLNQINNLNGISFEETLAYLLVFFFILQFELIILYFCHIINFGLFEFKKIREDTKFLVELRKLFSFRLLYYYIKLLKAINNKFSVLERINTRKGWNYIILVILYFVFGISIYIVLILNILLLLILIFTVILVGLIISIIGLTVFPIIVIIDFIIYRNVRSRSKGKTILRQTLLDDFFDKTNRMRFTTNIKMENENGGNK